MKIFILGASGSGQTPFAAMIGEKLGIKVASASDWLNKLSEGISTKSKQEYIDTTTELAVRELRGNQNACFEFIKETNDLSKPLIIEGCRNPKDFIQLFDPMKDVVVFLNRDANPYHTTAFEHGIVVIDGYVNWTAKVGLLDKEKRINFKYDIKELSSVVDNFVQFFKYKDWCLLCGDTGCHCSENNKI